MGVAKGRRQRRAVSKAPAFVQQRRPKVSQGEGWSASDDRKLLAAAADNAEAREWARGLGALGELAERMGRSPSAVRSRLRRLRRRGKAPGAISSPPDPPT